VIKTSRNINFGEEITISYIRNIDEDIDSRKASLAMYDFDCKCEKCIKESKK
jgi:hypothetical protein